jgi:SAM-dependent methyltransferase
MGTPDVYDDIGRHYAVTRRPDPRIAGLIDASLGDARDVLNVGAGAGSYEPSQRRVVAVEPSLEMIRQRSASSPPVVQAMAERLPFSDDSFDAALAVLTLHHWQDRAAGLAEMVRVARRRVVILTWDPGCGHHFWLTAEYFPAIVELDTARFPSPADIARIIGSVDVRPVPVPRDCRDGFLGAFWACPEAYLDRNVRRAISGFAQLPPSIVEAGIERLAGDLASGRWDARFGDLRNRDAVDIGYRLVVAER